MVIDNLLKEWKFIQDLEMCGNYILEEKSLKDDNSIMTLQYVHQCSHLII